MAVNKVILGDQTLIDLTADSVTPDKLFKGITAHNMKGESIVGTMEGGSTPSEPTDNTAVIFADYDGNLIDTWTKDEVASKTALPTPPTHSGLVFEGWNWTLEDIQTDTTGQVITVGPFYHTESGLTEIDIHLDEVTGKTAYIFNYANSSIDWGDGVTNTLYNHTYAEYGDYTIKTSASVVRIDYTVYVGQSGYGLSGGTFINQIRLGSQITEIEVDGQNIRNYITVHSLVKKVKINQQNNPIGCKTLVVPSMADCRITSGINTDYMCYPKQVGTMTVDSSPNNDCGSYYGKNMKYFYMPLNNNVTSIGNSAFYGCSSLQSIVIPSSVTSIGDSAFSGCSSLQSITIPENVTSIGNYAFRDCSSLQSITVPSNVTSIGNQAFYGCSSLQSITIPSSVTSIGSGAFRGCSSLQSITIPSSVTSIGNQAFYGCSSLQSITIPSSVTSIGNNAFYGWYGGKIVCNSSATINSNQYVSNTQCVYDFSGCKSIPVLSSSNGLTDWKKVGVIYVPLSLYDEWIAATNWVAYASKIKKASEVENTEVTG